MLIYKAKQLTLTIHSWGRVYTRKEAQVGEIERVVVKKNVLNYVHIWWFDDFSYFVCDALAFMMNLSHMTQKN